MPSPALMHGAGSTSGSEDRQRLQLATLAAIALGAVLRWPVLLTPLYSDDLQQLAMLRGAFLLQRPAWNLFWFGPRTHSEWQRLVAFGFDPWWTAAGHRLSMFRPLSSLLIAVDAGALGADPVLCHLHSLLWWAALVACVALLFSRLLPGRIGAIAVILFALDEAHAVPLSWLANRSTLVASTFGVLALFAHLRAREPDDAENVRSRAHRGWLALSTCAWALALSAGEYAFGMLAYLAAFELTRSRQTLAARLLYLAPAAVVTALYLTVRAALGIGVAGSGFYVGPSDPVRYLAQAATHAPALAGDLVLGVSASWWQDGPPWRNFVLELELFDPTTWSRLPDWHSAQVAIGVLALVAGVIGLRGLTGRPARETTALRGLLLGSLLALPTAAGATPSARLLVAPALGASALLAALLVLGASQLSRSRAKAGAARWPALLLCGSILLVHGALAARNAYAYTAELRSHAELSLRWALDAEIPRAAADLDIVIVTASDFATAVNLPWLRLARGLPLPRSYRRLSGALQAHDIKRIDQHSIELAVLSNDVSDAFAGSIYRTREDGLSVGQRVRLPGMEVEVLGVDGGNPWRLRVRFDRALDDPHLLWLHARPEGLRRFDPPRVGETLRLPRAAAPWDRER